jgi:hypothetical protein
VGGRPVRSRMPWGLNAPGPQLSREGLAEVVAVVGSLVLVLSQRNHARHARRYSATSSKPVRPRMGSGPEGPSIQSMRTVGRLGKAAPLIHHDVSTRIPAHPSPRLPRPCAGLRPPPDLRGSAFAPPPPTGPPSTGRPAPPRGRHGRRRPADPCQQRRRPLPRQAGRRATHLPLPPATPPPVPRANPAPNAPLSHILPRRTQ